MNPERVWTEAEVRALVETLEAPMSAVRGDRIVATNRAYRALVGMTAEELQGRSWLSFLPPEERQRLEQRIRVRAAEGPGAGETLPVLVFGAGGRRVHMLIRSTFLRAEGGGLIAVAVCLEQTEAQRAQELYELLAAVAATAVAERSEGAARSALVRGLREAGLRPAFLTPGDSGWDAAAREAVETLRPIYFGAQSGLPEGVMLPLSGAPGPQSPPSALGPLVMRLSGPGLSSQSAPTFGLFARLWASALGRARLIDELERKDLETRRALADTQVLLELARTTSGTLELRAILDVASDFLVRLLDLSNCFVLLYDARARVLRGAAASAAHREFFRSVELDVDGPGVAATAARERRAVIVEDTGITNLEGHTELVQRFGEKALFALPLLVRGELLGVVVLDDTRGPRHFDAHLVRLAEASAGLVALAVANARLYESLRKSYAQLEETRAEGVKRERLAALGELSAVVAHEVRNPLGVIFNATSSLRRLVSHGGDAQMLLGIIAEESDRLNRIVSELLDFARPRALSLQLESLESLVRESVEAARADRSLASRVRFEVDLPKRLPPLPIDRHVVRQALVNVLLNAMQAMPQGGTVRLRVRAEPDAPVPHVCVEVEDAGPGIPPELLGRVFEPFFTTKARGTGLGLAVVKRIVEDHRGEVSVRSKPGQGTVFTFRLPLAAGEATGL